ncbi:IS1595 family transposase [Nitrobacter vulgaris]|uniref:IS1595 family transposase n=1 Tax=Nitrobacter vulgaris TaxID=29421 RepID=A0A1V4HW62_NITVU|nr:IS1595 family transposase [Nitrobacter vulgaris]OPH82119.1 IS1595 family transposase [Nitrobacter vulgaris]
MSQFNAAHFQTVEAAREYLEALRWGGERVCPHCGSLNSFATKKAGIYRCREKECRKDFSVTTKSVMESSHIKLHIWLQAFYLMASSKKGVSSHQLHRAIGVTYKTAWFLSHRIREAMRAGGLVAPMGGEGSIVEADETYFGNVPESKRRTKTTSGRPFTKSGRTGPSNKRAIVSLVERGGNVRSFHVAVADASTVAGIVTANIHHETRLHTDESRLYTKVGAHFATHETINHSHKEYARGDVTTNSVEGYFSIFKRGMKGVYQHCAEKHLHRYLSEYDFRYNHRVKLGYNDGERADLAIKGAAGKRLTYRQSH